MVLYGRAADLELVTRFALGDTRARYPVLLVTGDAGIGKSALLDAVVASAERSGRRVQRSSAVEYEAELMFGGLDAVLLPMLDHLERLSPLHREAVEIVCGLRSGSPPTQLIAGAASLALVTAVATVDPLLVVVDDAALLDRASAMVIAYVARRAEGSRVRFLLSSRSDVENAFVRSGFDTYALAPLSARAADELVASRFPGLDRDARRRIVDLAEGNPLALLDLPTSNAAAVPLPDVAPLAERLRAVYGEQVLGLPLGTRRLLLRMVLGRPETDLTRARLDALADDPRELDPAVDAGLVRIDPVTDRVEFRHPLVRSAVVEASTLAERRQAHSDLAEVLRADPRRRAWHLAESASWPAPEVAAELETISDELLRTGEVGPSMSAILSSAELTDAEPDRRRRIARASYLAASVGGDLAESERLLLAAQPDPSSPLPLAVVAAGAHHLVVREGDAASAHRLLVAALDERGATLDAEDDAVTEALQTLVTGAIALGLSSFWDDIRSRLQRMLPSAPDTLALARDVFSGDRIPGDATDRLDGAVDGLIFTSDPLRIVRVAGAGSHLDRIDAARGALQRVVEDGRGGGAIPAQIEALFLLAAEDAVTGDWRSLAVRTDEGLALSRERGYALLGATGRYLRGLGDAARGYDEAADGAVEQILQWAAPRGLVTLASFASHIQCVRALAEGRFDDARRHAASVDPIGTVSPMRPTSLWMILDTVEAAARSGHETEAREHVDAAIAAGVPALSHRLRMIVDGAAAIVAADDWRERFDAALESPGCERYAFDRARIRLAYGERLRRERHPGEARTQLARASAGFERLGARPWLERADRELRAAGGSSMPGWSALTPQEEAVARLAAQGLTNKEIGERLFLSSRTVSTHLSHVFAKLGVASRHELDPRPVEPAPH